MEFFIDTANIEEIKAALSWGIFTGVTTNQKIFLKEKGVNFEERIKEILSLINGPLSVELTKTQMSIDEMIDEAKTYSKLNPKKITIKVPMFKDGRGLTIVNLLNKEKIKTNMTALMNVNQLLLAAKAGATYASIFYNRIKDADGNPNKVISNSRKILDREQLDTKIIVGSIRRLGDVSESIISGAHIVTIPYKILISLPWHWKTEETIKEFDMAWLEFIKK